MTLEQIAEARRYRQEDPDGYARDLAGLQRTNPELYQQYILSVGPPQTQAFPAPPQVSPGVDDPWSAVPSVGPPQTQAFPAPPQVSPGVDDPSSAVPVGRAGGIVGGAPFQAMSRRRDVVRERISTLEQALVDLGPKPEPTIAGGEAGGRQWNDRVKHIEGQIRNAYEEESGLTKDMIALLKGQTPEEREEIAQLEIERLTTANQIAQLELSQAQRRSQLGEKVDQLELDTARFNLEQAKHNWQQSIDNAPLDKQAKELANRAALQKINNAGKLFPLQQARERALTESALGTAEAARARAAVSREELEQKQEQRRIADELRAAVMAAQTPAEVQAILGKELSATDPGAMLQLIEERAARALRERKAEMTAAKNLQSARSDRERNLESARSGLDTAVTAFNREGLATPGQTGDLQRRRANVQRLSQPMSEAEVAEMMGLDPNSPRFRTIYEGYKLSFGQAPQQQSSLTAPQPTSPQAALPVLGA